MFRVISYEMRGRFGDRIICFWLEVPKGELNKIYHKFSMIIKGNKKVRPSHLFKMVYFSLEIRPEPAIPSKHAEFWITDDCKKEKVG